MNVDGWCVIWKMVFYGFEFKLGCGLDLFY